MHLIPDVTTAYAKAACYVCGRGGAVVDTGAQIEGEGTLAICPACIAEACRLSQPEDEAPAKAKK